MDSRSVEDLGVILPPVASAENYENDPQEWDIIIVGAGVAGSALAYAQGREHRRALVLERSLQQPDRIVGELLQPGGFMVLQSLGLVDCTEGIDAQKVTGYAIFKDGKHTSVEYPTQDNTVAGRSFHHGRFVQKLRWRAAECPSVSMRQAVALRLVTSSGDAWNGSPDTPVAGVVYKTPDGVERTARAHLTVACDGMYSSLRKHLHGDADSIEKTSTFVGLILRDVTLPYPNHGHVILGRPSPILVYPISSTEARVLVDIPPDQPVPSAATGALRAYLHERVRPQLPETLRSAFDAALAAGKLRSMQNKRLSAQPLHPPGALLLGDAFNMRHPLTGGGMTVALSDTNLLCDMLHVLPDFSNSLQTAEMTSAFYLRRKPLSSTINTLANALYEVFREKPSEAHEEMRQAAFDYLSLGGIYSSGPIGLLSGLTPQPHILIMHFFMVALFGVGRLPMRKGLRGCWLAIMLLVVAVRIIVPIIWAEGLRAVFLPRTAPQPYLRRVQNLQRVSSMEPAPSV